MSILPITTDQSAMTVMVGEAVFDTPQMNVRPEKDVFYKSQICGEAPWHLGMKAAYQFYGALLGSKFNRRFQAANYWLWVGDRFMPSTANLLRHRGFYWKRYDNRLVQMAHLARHYVNEAERDGLNHLIPAIVAFRASPASIRREIGPASWRRIAHNSISRNKAILQACIGGRNDGFGAAFAACLDFPSGVLPAIQLVDHEEAIAARLTPRKTTEAFLQTVHTVRDAMRMGVEINPEWGLARIRREHDAAVREQRKGHFSSAAFTEAWQHECDGYVATLLVSPLEIVIEGDTQHHCVGSYANEAKRGAYAVLSIEGKARATAGYSRSASGGWRLQQVYGACNAQVSEDCRDFAAAAGLALSQRDILRRAA